MKKFFKNNWICLLSLLIFCVITIPKLLTHFPWYDEAHAWQLSNYMTLDNWISVLSREGHFIIWYLVLMPFAKLHFGYPYSMLIMNWLFYFLSLIVIWKKHHLT